MYWYFVNDGMIDFFTKKQQVIIKCCWDFPLSFLLEEDFSNPSKDFVDANLSNKIITRGMKSGHQSQEDVIVNFPTDVQSIKKREKTKETDPLLEDSQRCCCNCSIL